MCKSAMTSLRELLALMLIFTLPVVAAAQGSRPGSQPQSFDVIIKGGNNLRRHWRRALARRRRESKAIAS